MRRSCLLFAILLGTPIVAGETITIPMRRELPPHVKQKYPELAASEERTLPLSEIGCEGKARLRALRYSLSFVQINMQWQMRMSADAEVEKLASGPLQPPAITFGGEPATTFFFENSMASARWEEGGTFAESFYRGEMQDGSAWTSVTLRCSGDSPYHAAVIPEGVTYKRAGEEVLAQAVKNAEAALRGDKGFGTASLYDPELMTIGPDLFDGVKDDPALQNMSSPKMITIDPATQRTRGMLRIQGAKEAAQFGEAMRRYLGNARPRLRAATSAELARFWLNIGWEIEEPLLIADYGKHRIVLDFDDKGRVEMVDEIPASGGPATSTPSASAPR